MTYETAQARAKRAYYRKRLLDFADMTGDDEITLEDVLCIAGCARQFGVSEHMAYMRAKTLGLLSYQQPGERERRLRAAGERDAGAGI